MIPLITARQGLDQVPLGGRSEVTPKTKIMPVSLLVALRQQEIQLVESRLSERSQKTNFFNRSFKNS